MKDFFNDRVSKEDLDKIFKSSLERELFISEYPFIKSDDNMDYYVHFIDSNIFNRKYLLQEHAIEMSIAVSVFKSLYLDAIKKILFSRRNDWIKLLALDWIFNFRDLIPEDEYVNINNQYLSGKANELIRVQAILNLIMFSPNYCNFLSLYQLLSLSEDPASFYRVVNSLDAITLPIEEIRDVRISLLNLFEKKIFLNDALEKQFIAIFSING
ncbi:MAG: hypothetical protein EOO43_20330 [Flavobacterium sp.]|nr:MAG: hypothetical protein EOO43_20330 [Flavobacterium sp.]